MRATFGLSNAKRLIGVLTFAALASCAQPSPDGSPQIGPNLPPNQRLAPPDRVLAREITRTAPDALPGQCWAHEGVGTSTEVHFRTPCADVFSKYFLSTLQRAMTARGLYHAPITGVLDAPTSAAIRAWQTPRGIESATISLQGAKILGLLRWETP